MASGDTLVVFNALNGFSGGTNSATLDFRNDHPVLDFDASTNESAIFTGVMPNHYGSNGIKVVIHFSMTSATTGDVDWDISIETIQNESLDIDSDGFDTVNSYDNNGVPGNAGQVSVLAPAAALTDPGSPALSAGDLFRLKITRDAASDTAANDAELHAIELREA